MTPSGLELRDDPMRYPWTTGATAALAICVVVAVLVGYMRELERSVQGYYHPRFEWTRLQAAQKAAAKESAADARAATLAQLPTVGSADLKFVPGLPVVDAVHAVIVASSEALGREAADALLSQAESTVLDKAAQRGILARIIQKWPHSTAARKAAKALQAAP